MARPISFRQRLALQLGAKQNQRPASTPYGSGAAFCGLKNATKYKMH